MSLDLNKVSDQVSSMVQDIRNNLVDRQRQTADAIEIMHVHSGDIQSLKTKIDGSKTTWLVAGIVDALDVKFPAPGIPTDYTVIATDGSHIEADRHQAANCYLLNISHVVLCYGSKPDAVLESIPQLYARDEDLAISPPDGKGREQAVEDTLLGAKRTVEECRHLADLAVNLPAGATGAALLDGTLMLWGLEPYPEFVKDLLLDKGLLNEFERIRQSSKDKRLAFGSYISAPRSTDVTNALRVAVCPHDTPDCDSYCGHNRRDCNDFAGLDDSQLFLSLLAPGERSALFTSGSKIIKDHYGDHAIYFFYMRIDDEIARVELPEWVAEDNSLVELTHGLILDQCRKGDGYPVALSEAHEQAVVTISDRQNFWQLVEANMIERHLPTHTTGKSRSKKSRWV